jgi:hypothetical protein
MTRLISGINSAEHSILYILYLLIIVLRGEVKGTHLFTSPFEFETRQQLIVVDFIKPLQIVADLGLGLARHRVASMLFVSPIFRVSEKTMSKSVSVKLRKANSLFNVAFKRAVPSIIVEFVVACELAIENIIKITRSLYILYIIKLLNTDMTVF